MQRTINRILLINPPNHELHSKVPTHIRNHAIPPVGLLTIASVLKIYDYKVDLIDMFIKDFPLNSLCEKIEEFQPQVVAFTTYSLTIDVVRELSKIIRDKIDCYIILGGPHATIDSTDLILESEFDYVICNEGEFSMVHLMDYLNDNLSVSLESIPGLVYLDKDNNVRKNKRQDFITDLDCIPMPAYNLVKQNDYLSPLSFVTSRGCPGRCVYCASMSLSGSKYRSFSAEYLFSMIIEFSKFFKKNYFSLLEDTFTADAARVKRFCDLMINHEESFDWACFSRVDIPDTDIFKPMRIAGCSGVNFGVESGSQKVLNLIRKEITLEQVEKAVKITADLGMYVNCSFIIGHYCDTRETVNKTIEYARYLRDTYGANVGFTVNTPFKATYQHTHAERLGLKFSSEDCRDLALNKVNISTKYLSSQDIEELFLKATELMK